MIGWLDLDSRHAVGTSISIAVTFFPASASVASSGGPTGFEILTRSKVSPKIYHEWIFALTDKDPTRCAAAGNINRVNILVRIGLVVAGTGEGFVANIVGGLGEGLRSAARISEKSRMKAADFFVPYRSRRHSNLSCRRQISDRY